MLDENWVEGQCNNRSGIAPASYLEVRKHLIEPFLHLHFFTIGLVCFQSMNSDKEKRMEKMAKEGQARAKYDFNAQSQVEMSLKKGESTLPLTLRLHLPYTTQKTYQILI